MAQFIDQKQSEISICPSFAASKLQVMTSYKYQVAEMNDRFPLLG